MTEDIGRRRFLGAAAMTLAAAQLGVFGSAEAAVATKRKAVSHASLGPIQQIDAGVLNVGYVEAGPRDGHPVVLLHGWPYDIHSFVDVAPPLASSRHRVIVPPPPGYRPNRVPPSAATRDV